MATSLLGVLISTDYRNKGVVAAQTALKGLGGQVQTVGKELGIFNLSGLASAGIVAGMAAAVKKAVGDYVSYNDQIRQNITLTGMSAEETSRLTQLTDDYGIGSEKLRTLLEGANKNGFQPSIENIAKLSDEYMALTDPVERNQLLVDKFGKSGMQFAEVMKLGSDAIREKAAAVKDGLIVDEAALEASLAYKMSLDDLDDTFTAFANALGQETVPVLTDVIDFFLKGIEAGTKLKDMAQGLEGVWKEHNLVMLETADSYDAYVKEMIRAGLEGGLLEGASVNQAKAFLDGSLATEKTTAVLTKLTGELGIASESTWKVEQATKGLTTTSQSWMDELDRGGPLVSNLNAGLQDLVNKGIKNLNTAMDGAVGAEMESFRAKSGEISDQMKGIAGQIDILKEKKWLTQDQQTELVGLETEYKNLQTELGNTATAHEEAMQKISYSLLEARLGIDGFTQAELDVLNSYAGMTGMIDEPTRILNESISLLTTQWENGKQPVDNYMAAFEYLNDAIKDGVISAGEMHSALELLNGREINIGFNIDVKGDPIPDFGLTDPDAPVVYGTEDDTVYGGMRAAGGAASSDKWYWVGERGPERFYPGQDGTIVPNGATSPSAPTIIIQNYGSVRNDMDIELIARKLADMMQRRR